MTLPVALEWFEKRSLSDGVTLFSEPHIDPYMQPNTWHVRGRDRDLVIDTGMGIGDLRGAMGKLVDRPILAVATHTHFDHIGSHHEFEERACHAAEADILANPTLENTVADLFLNDDSIRAIPDADYQVGNYAISPAPPTQILSNGDIIDLGDRTFEVLHLPGHSPGSIGLFERETGIFFSGDVVYDGDILDELYHSHVETYIDSMRRLRELPVRVVHCGHYGSFDRHRMIELIDTYINSKSAPVCPAETIGTKRN